MSSRRRVLLGSISLSLVGVAGCQSLLGANVQEARQHLEAADEDFDQAREEYADQTETMFDPEQEVSFETDPILAAVDSARDELDRAAEIAGDAVAAELSAYRTYADYIEQLARGLGDLSNALNHLYDASSYIESVRMADANRAIQNGLDDLDLAAGHHGNMNRLLSDIDASYLEDEDVGYARMQSALDEIGEYITGLRDFLEGYDRYTAGYETLLEAAELYDSAEYGSAETRFESARSTFDDAESRFRQGESRAPQYMHENFVSLVCLASNTREAAELYTQAAQFAENGNVDSANERSSQAESALNRQC